MKLMQNRTGAADVIEVEGRIDASTSKDLETALVGLAGEDGGPVVVDFSRVDYISSAGLRVLLVGLKALSASDRRLALASMNPDVRDVVTLTGMDKVLDCFDDVETALA